MTVPVTLDWTSSTFTSATAHAVSMPASALVNDGLLSAFTFNSASTVTTPTGWSIICTVTLITTGPTLGSVIYGKVAAGTEGGTTVDHVTDVATVATAIVIRIDARTWSRNIADMVGATASNVAASQPNPPSVAWSWGTFDELVFATAHLDAAVTLTSYPTNYINGHRMPAAGNLVSATLVAERARVATASPEDPGAYAISAGDSWVANTVVVKGAPSPARRSQISRQAVNRASFI